MDVLVWVLAAVFGLNFLVLGWFAGLELLTQHRLNREIRELDELWREFTTVPAVSPGSVKSFWVWPHAASQFWFSSYVASSASARLGAARPAPPGSPSR